jgi:C4-dicarboxylate-specific signal transduction histidine kinase
MNLEAVIAATAHEVRQPLASINLQAAAGKRFLERTPPDIASIRASFDAIIGAGQHTNEIFDSIRALFRNVNENTQSINVNELVVQSLQGLRAEFSAHRRCHDCHLCRGYRSGN